MGAGDVDMTGAIAARPPGRSAPARLMLCLVLALSLPSPAHSLDPERRFDQFHHTSWSFREGLPFGINAIAQTPDGSLWLGTASGLYRFDGIRSERVGRAQIPFVVSLATGANGDLWIGLPNA